MTTLIEETPAPAPAAGSGGERLLGRCSTGRPGPLVVVTAAIHGNEPAGTHAFRQVAARLEADRLPLAGELLGLTGNARALARKRRFLTRDLNRRWSAPGLTATLALERARHEDLEQRELLEVLAPLLAAAERPIVFLDLHSTSSAGAPFVAMADVLRNRPVALALPIPLVLGLEEFVDDSMLGYLCDLGHVGVAIEAGQHDDPRTIEHHETAIWLALAATGALPAAAIPERERRVRRLAQAARGLPRVVEIRHRHRVSPGDRYVMEPGFANFTPVAAGRVVANARRGPVRAPQSGVIMLPLYQRQGEDGYFLARPVSRFWLALSRVLRLVRLDRALPQLPGVDRDPDRPDHYLVDPRVARFLVTETFHLLGYRRVRGAGERLAFSRRRPDHGGVRCLPGELTGLRAPG